MTRWYAWDVLEAEVIRTLGGHAAHAHGASDGWSDHDIATTLGCTVAAVRKRRERRVMTDVTADRYAVAAGLHPASVWPEWFDA